MAIMSCRSCSTRLGWHESISTDRKAGVLRAPLVKLEPGAPAETVERLKAELDDIAGWLGLGAVQIGAVV